jgi:hypothetical protein
MLRSRCYQRFTHFELYRLQRTHSLLAWFETPELWPADVISGAPSRALGMCQNAYLARHGRSGAALH